MTMICRGPIQKLQLSFNSNGQPFGTKSAKFVSFLGVIVREHIPIVIEWKNLVEENWKSLRDDLWSLVQQSFVVNDTYKDLIFTTMGKYWRQYKSKITTKIIKANELPDKVHALQLIKPSNVKSVKDWDTFVKTRLTASFKNRREMFKEMRMKQKYTHTMSRKGYARLENELKENHPNPNEITRVELWKKAYEKKNGDPINEAAGEIMEKITKCIESENPPTNDCIRDDALARVLGPEPRGRVRGLGFGVTPSKVDATVICNARVKELETKVAMFQAKFESYLKGNEQGVQLRTQKVLSKLLMKSLSISSVEGEIKDLMNFDLVRI